jgi:hypothetical protein
MTTIAFDNWEQRFTKKNFSDVFDFLEYVSRHFTKTEILSLAEDEITPEIKQKMKETQSLPYSEFVNL